MLTVLLTSSRVAPGLLTLAAWDALRGADLVLADSAEHPLAPALAEAGVGYQVVPDRSEVPGLAASVSSAVWLAVPGAEESFPAATQLRGSRDLPGSRLLDVVATMDTLRTECPWDAKQTHASLAPHLLEEPYEALEALETGDDAGFREELGDILLQVAFHARIASERQDGYTIDDVAETLVAKLVRRHPHVFAGLAVEGADEVKRNWDEIKRAERAERAGAASPEQPSVLDGVPFGQPALALAAQLQRRAARAGAPPSLATPPSPPAPSGDAATAPSSDAAPSATPAPSSDTAKPVPSGDDLGDELFRLVARAREADLDPELELRAAARRYRDRVRSWERSRDQP